MAGKFSELEAEMSPESRARSDAKAKRMLAELGPDQPTDADIREPNRAPIWNGRRNLEAAENSPAPHEASNSPTKPNEPACTECSRLASRVEELEQALREIALTLKVGHGTGAAEGCRMYAEKLLAGAHVEEK